jgi:hypothetical protein
VQQEPVSVAEAAESRLFKEDFAHGLDCAGSTAKWVLRPTPTRPQGDGVAVTSPAGLVVTPTATDPATGLPAFARDSDQAASAGHLRWAAFANRLAGSGVIGFALPERGVLTARMTLSAELYNVAGHPYGAQVADPDRSLLCGMAAMICVDLQSGLVFDFALTNRVVWALYERLPRPGAGHGTFSYAIPVAERDCGSVHQFAISVDAAAGQARWSLDGVQVFATGEIGRRLASSEYLVRQTEGPDERVAPRQVSLGFGLFADPVWGQGMRLTARSAEVATSAA